MHTNTWADLHILVTRPETLAGPLLAQLAAKGAQTTYLPTLAIRFLTDTTPVQQAITQLTDYQWHIFVSRHAVQAVMPQIKDKWSMLELTQRSWAAVGLGTQSELARFIPCDIVYPRTNLGGAALVTALEHKMHAKDSALIWCGDAPSPNLANGLCAQGVVVTQVMCYQREMTDVDQAPVQRAFQQGEINVVLVSSGASLTHLLTLLTPVHAQLMTCTLIVVSQRLVNLARDLGFCGKIILADGADDAAMINTIEKNMTR